MVILLVGCTGEISHDYPREKQREIVENQGKYGTIQKDFILEKSSKDGDGAAVNKASNLQDLCNISGVFMAQNFANHAVITSNNSMCLMQANSGKYTYNLAISAEEIDFIAFYKNGVNITREALESKKYKDKLLIFLKKNGYYEK